MNLKHKDNHKISSIFTLIMIAIITVSMVLSFIINYYLLRLEFNPITGALTSTYFIAFSSVIVGMVISSYTSKRILSPIMKINDATKKVAKGDFTVRLEENSVANEIREISQNFNIMVKELSNTETLQNDFVSNVSHEFKTPLAAIEGFTMLLQDDSLSREEQKKYINKILENTHRLTNLTQSILSLSRLENQEIVMQKEHFQLDEQIRYVLLDYQDRWEEKNINIDLYLDDIVFFGNKGLLAQVWSNLIDNAIKFSSINGTLSIRCNVVEKNVVVAVTDSGLGMTKEIKKHAFEKFFQGEHSHNGKGNGLGLALVKRIVTLCGGKVYIESEIDKGTTVTVTLKIE